MPTTGLGARSFSFLERGGGPALDRALHLVRLDTGGADVAAHRRAALEDADPLDVRVPAARGAPVGEAHRDPEARVHAAGGADGRHRGETCLLAEDGREREHAPSKSARRYHDLRRSGNAPKIHESVS